MGILSSPVGRSETCVFWMGMVVGVGRWVYDTDCGAAGERWRELRP